MVDVGRYTNTWMVWGLFLFVKVLGELKWGDGQKNANDDVDPRSLHG